MPITVEEIKEYLKKEMKYQRCSLFDDQPDVATEKRGALKVLKQTLDFIENKESEASNE